MMEKKFNKKALTRAATLIKAKQPDNRLKLRGCAYYNILIPLRQQKKGMDRMISVMDVLMIFAGGFISAKVCDYVHELEREENEA